MTVELAKGPWPTARLEELLARPLAYGVLKPGEHTADGVPLVRIQDVHTGRLDASRMSRISPALHHEFRRTQLAGGELLLSIVGTLGKVVEVPPELHGANISRALCVLGVGERVQRKFLVQFLRSGLVQSWIEGKAQGNAQAVLNLGVLRDLAVPLPPIWEQRKIDAILSSVDDAIEATQAVINQLQVVKKAMMAQLLTRGLPGRHTRFKQTEIGEVPEEWTTGSVGDFLTLQRGFDITERMVIPGDVPVISSGGISYYHQQAKVLGPGVVTGRKGKLGAVFFVPGAFWPHDTTLWVSNFKGNDPRFVAWYLRGLALEKLDSATAVPTLNRNNVHPLPAAFPPIQEQAEIAAILDDISERLRLEQSSLDAVGNLKSALMSVLLTGEVRVKPDEAAP